jgi:ParB/RepB/Spo0J family partition protein
VSAAAAVGRDEIRSVAIGRLLPSPTNPRKHFDELRLNELADSIKSHGVLQHLLVRRDKSTAMSYEIVAGERRWRAAQLASLSELQCVVRDLTDDQVLEIQVIENGQREDVDPVEEAAGFKMLLDRKIYDVAGLAAKIGKTPSYVYARLKLLDLCEEAKQELANPASRFTMSHALVLARLPRLEDQRQAVTYVCGHWRPVSPADLREWINDSLMKQLADAPFPLDDAALVPEAGACTSCPRRTGTQHALFAELTESDQCLDVPCFDGKRRAFVERRKTEVAEKTGVQPVVISTGYSKERGVLTPGAFEPCKKSDPQAVPAVRNESGELTWVKLPEQKAKSDVSPGLAATRDTQARERAINERVVGAIRDKLVELPDAKLLAPKVLALSICGAVINNFNAAELKEFVARREVQVAEVTHQAVLEAIAGDTPRGILANLVAAELYELDGPWAIKTAEQLAAAAGLDLAGIAKEVKTAIKAEEKAKQAAEKAAEQGDGGDAKKKAPAKKKAAKKK